MAWSKAARDAAIASRRAKAKGASNKAAAVSAYRASGGGNKQGAIMSQKSAEVGSLGLNAYRRATGRPGLDDRSAAASNLAANKARYEAKHGKGSLQRNVSAALKGVSQRSRKRK
jgi:hypothetical protein